MMVSLFSVFDPVSFMGVPMNWLILVIAVFMVPLYYFILDGVILMINDFVSGIFSMMFKDISFPKYKGLIFLGFILFLSLGIMNIIGLFPFIFTASGHLVITLSLGMMLWMSSFMMGWLMSFSVSSAHMVPEGSPIVLAPFMVTIESISHLIRPITLSVRLAANMMAGHLIIGLISSISLLSFSVFWISVVLQGMMLLLEVAVCFIQAFVFSVLVILYSLDFY